MKKLFALLLALILALTGVCAFADTVYTHVTIDGDALKGLMTGFGVPENQMGVVDPVLALVNALGVKVTTVADGAQVDLDLNGKSALSLGWTTDDSGVTVASTLIPNCVVTARKETLEQMIAQFMANMPGAGEGGEGGMPDFAAAGEVFGEYFARYFAACASAGQPGEPVTGEYEFEGYTFDTMVPVTVDMNAIRQATTQLLDGLLADPAAMSMLKGYAQGFAQSSGEAFDEADFEASLKAGFEEWLAHLPETASAEVYANSDGSESFYMTARSAKTDGGEADFTCDMLFVDGGNMSMGFAMDMAEAGTMEASFALQGTDMRMDFSMGGAYIGLGISFTESRFVCDLYFMDPGKPLITVDVVSAEGGERTLPVDGEGKTAVALEDLMNDQTGEVAGSLVGDLMGNGLGALMGVLGEQVPEVAGMLSMFSGSAEAAG